MCYIDTQVVEKSEVRVLIVRAAANFAVISNHKTKRINMKPTESVIALVWSIGVSPDSPRHTRNGRKQANDLTGVLKFRRSDVSMYDNLTKRSGGLGNARLRNPFWTNVARGQ